MSDKNLQRVIVQSGCLDRMGRPIGGVFVVYLDREELREQMERAYNNQGHKSKFGSTIVHYQAAPKGQSDWIAAHPEACGLPLAATLPDAEKGTE